MVNGKGANSKLLRQNNKATILWRLFSDGPMSRIALAKLLNLSGAAITILIKDLFEEGLVIDSGKKLQRNVAGRKEVIIDINYDDLIAYNINIEKDKMHFSICSLKKIIVEKIIDTKEFIAATNKAKFITEILGSLGSYTALGVGVGISRYKKGDTAAKDFNINNIEEWSSEISKALNMPVFVSNNVRSHAKALINYNKANFLYIKHGPGVGSAVVCNGEVLEGANNQAGEIGHSLVDSDSVKTVLLESYVSEQRIIKKYLNNESARIYDIYAMYPEDIFAKAIIDDCIQVIVNCIYNTATLVDPSAIILSGGMFDSEKIFEVIKNRLNILPNKTEVKKISGTKLKSFANARLVFDNILFS